MKSKTTSRSTLQDAWDGDQNVLYTLLDNKRPLVQKFMDARGIASDMQEDFLQHLYIVILERSKRTQLPNALSSWFTHTLEEAYTSFTPLIDLRALEGGPCSQPKTPEQILGLKEIQTALQEALDTVTEGNPKLTEIYENYLDREPSLAEWRLRQDFLMKVFIPLKRTFNVSRMTWYTADKVGPHSIIKYFTPKLDDLL